MKSGKLEQMVRELEDWSRRQLQLDGVTPLLRLDDSLPPGVIACFVTEAELEPAQVKMHHDTWTRVQKLTTPGGDFVLRDVLLSSADAGH